MANLKISELTTAGALTGAELVEIVQGGLNKKSTTQDIADLGGGGGAVDSVNTQTGVVVLDAGDIGVTPAGNIVSTNVQAALEELDSDISSGLAGLKWKDPVRVATTVTGTLASDFENGDTVDGIVLATGNRILIKDQSAQTENGIYTVNASGAPTRSTDADAAAELEGAAVSVQEGTANANTTWLQTTDNITLGVSNIVWGQFGSSVPDASATVKGIVELATSAEVLTGTDTVRAVTPEGARAVYQRGLAAVAATGAVVSFAVPQYYGSAAAITGNITFSTTGAVLGMEQVMRHNDSVQPSVPSEFKVMQGSRDYVTGVDNYYYMKYLSATKIQFTINQEV